MGLAPLWAIRDRPSEIRNREATQLPRFLVCDPLTLSLLTLSLFLREWSVVPSS
jgi:hypothetical protein